MRRKHKATVKDPGLPTNKESYLAFRLYIEKNYYTVIVFKTKKYMYEYAKKIDAFSNMNDEKYDFEARVTGWRVVSGNKQKKEAGRIIFYPRAISINVVSHEISHAVLYWYWYHAPKKYKWNLKQSRKEEERYCSIVGDLNRLAWKVLLDKMWNVLKHGIPPTNKTMRILAREECMRKTKKCKVDIRATGARSLRRLQ